MRKEEVIKKIDELSVLLLQMKKYFMIMKI